MIDCTYYRYLRTVSVKELIDRAAGAAVVLSPWWIAFKGLEKQIGRTLTEEEKEFFTERVNYHFGEKENDPH